MHHLTVKKNMRKEGNLLLTKNHTLFKVWDSTFNQRPYEEYSSLVKNEKTKEILSDRNKVLIEIHGSPYHHIVHTYGYILNALDSIDNPLFIFNTTALKAASCNINFIEFFYCFLKENNIDHVFLDAAVHENLIVNNFYNANALFNQPIPNPIEKISKSFSKYIRTANATPSKKTYLSRNKVNVQLFEFKDQDVDSVNKMVTRVHDEKSLEAYFKSKGFDVVCPEDFSSFEEQINYFNNVKTLVSLSGGGSLNCIFMQPQTTVIELTTYLTTPSIDEFSDGKFIESHHHFFSSVCHEKDIFYHSVKNEEKLSKKIIDKLESNKHIMGIINE